jgi:hypothetical protein
MTPFAQRRTFSELRFATRVLFVRYRVIDWTPPEPPKPHLPAWVRRGNAKDFTGDAA